MTEARREMILIGAVILLGVAGLATESLSDPVVAPPDAPVEARHVERATFCPPAVAEDGTKTQIAVASSAGTGIPIDYEDALGPDDAAPPPPKPSSVDDGSFLLHKGDDAAISTVGYGERPVAGAIQSWTTPTEGAGAALCSERPSGTWYFPAGSSELGLDERILLYNPYPDEAVARITLYGPTGEDNAASLNQIAVPSGSWTEVELNKFIRTQKLVSAKVDAVRGRLIAWRALFSKPENGPRGVTMTLGAPEASDTWYFPHGLLAEDSGETFTILNPSDEEVIANVAIFSADVGAGAAAELTEIRLEPGTSRNVSLEATQLNEDVDVAHLSAVVTTQGADVIVERSLALDEGGYSGVSNEVGATKPGTRWLVPPLGESATDDSLAILNATRKAARVNVSLYTLKGPKRPKALRDLKVEPARRLEKSLDEYSEDEPFYAVVTSDRPVTVERLGTVSGDLVDVMGRSVAPSTAPE